MQIFLHSFERDVLLQMTSILALLCYSALSASLYLLGIVVWSSVSGLELWRLAQFDIVIVLCTISISSVLLRAISKIPIVIYQKMITALRFLTTLLASTVGQRCPVEEYPHCYELCDTGLSSPIVKGVYFDGVLANLSCVHPSLEVSWKQFFHTKCFLPKFLVQKLYQISVALLKVRPAFAKHLLCGRPKQHGKVEIFAVLQLG